MTMQIRYSVSEALVCHYYYVVILVLARNEGSPGILIKYSKTKVRKLKAGLIMALSISQLISQSVVLCNFCLLVQDGEIWAIFM